MAAELARVAAASSHFAVAVAPSGQSFFALRSVQALADVMTANTAILSQPSFLTFLMGTLVALLINQETSYDGDTGARCKWEAAINVGQTSNDRVPPLCCIAPKGHIKQERYLR